VWSGNTVAATWGAVSVDVAFNRENCQARARNATMDGVDYLYYAGSDSCT